jgi:hypothetical protein
MTAIHHLIRDRHQWFHHCRICRTRTQAHIVAR